MTQIESIRNALRMTPREAPFPLNGIEIPNPRPFLADLHVAADSMSQTIDHVSNVDYVRWLDRVAELHADSLGYTRQRLLGENIMWFVARHEIDYLAESHLGDELVIATWVRDMRRVKSWREYVVVRPSDETVICRAATLWVLVNLHTRRPARIPQEMCDAFAPLQARRADEISGA